MIIEIAQLQVRPGQTSEFEAAFDVAQHIISSMPGYLGHWLHKCIEQDHHYMLLVRWQSVEDHEVGFRKSAQYQEWRKLLHHFYDPFPTVLHYDPVGKAEHR
jgi:heme-degrading monooxygenase HmoA